MDDLMSYVVLILIAILVFIVLKNMLVRPTRKVILPIKRLDCLKICSTVLIPRVNRWVGVKLMFEITADVRIGINLGKVKHRISGDRVLLRLPEAKISVASIRTVKILDEDRVVNGWGKCLKFFYEIALARAELGMQTAAKKDAQIRVKEIAQDNIEMARPVAEKQIEKLFSRLYPDMEVVIEEE